MSRLAHSFFGAALVVVGASALANLPHAAGVPLAILHAVAGVVAAIRGLTLKIVLADGVVNISGLFWSRRISRSAVTGVSDFPAVQWRDEHGRSRWSPLVGVMTGGRNLAFVDRHNRAQVDSLRRWLRTR